MKRFILIVLAFLALLGVSLLLVPRRYLNTIAEEALVAEARRHKLRAHFDGFELTGSSFRAARMQLFSNPLLLGLDCDAPSVDVALLPILGGSLDGTLLCAPYGGSLHTRWQMPLQGGSGRVLFDASNLTLSEHPQIAAFGFSGGVLTITDGSLEIRENKVASLSTHVSLSKLGRSAPLTLSDFLPQLLPISIPAFEDLSLKGRVTLDQGVIEVQNLELASDWGRAVGSGRFSSTSREIDAKLQITLSDAGAQFLGPYLPLLPPGGLIASDRKIRLLVSGRVPMPRIEARRL